MRLPHRHTTHHHTLPKLALALTPRRVVLYTPRAVAQGGFAKIKTIFNPQVAKTRSLLTNMKRNVRVHLANQHGISMMQEEDTPSCIDEGVRDYASLMGEGGFVV